MAKKNDFCSPDIFGTNPFLGLVCETYYLRKLLISNQWQGATTK